MSVELMQGDCLEMMKKIPDGSVDMVLADPPYGTTNCKWDSVIPFAPVWEQLKRIVKQNGAIALFGSEPFSSELRMSNREMYRYDWIWDKKRGYNFAQSHKQPMKSHENVSVFYKRLPAYNPQYWYSRPYKTRGNKRRKKIEGMHDGSAPNLCAGTISEDGRRYPLSIIRMPHDAERWHTAQKPVALCEYLIKTYTDRDETVLDFTMGSGSTGVACVNTGRNFIGIELDERYFRIAKERIESAAEQLTLF